MRIFGCLLFILFACTSFAQFRITDIRGLTGSHSNDHKFPFVRGGDKKAAEKINRHLQENLLSNETVLTDPRTIFQNSVFIAGDSGGRSGITSLDYEVMLNNGRILSLQFEMETMGAYPEYYKNYYSFDARSGDPVLAKDIFTTEGIAWIKVRLLKERAGRIQEYLAGDNYEPEDSAFVRETYAECNQEPEEDLLFIQPGGIRFYKERCFPHAWRNLDDDLDIVLDFEVLERYLSDAGKKLLLK